MLNGKDLAIAGKAYIGGNVTAKNFYPGSGIINIKGDLNLEKAN